MSFKNHTAFIYVIVKLKMGLPEQWNWDLLFDLDIYNNYWNSNASWKRRNKSFNKRAIKYFVERFCEEKAIIAKKYWFSFSLTLILEII